MPSSASAAIFLASTLLAACTATPLQRNLQEATADAEWTYRKTGTAGEEPYGPDDWELGYPDCGLSRQSPINIPADLTTVATSADFDLQFTQNFCDSTNLTFTSDEAVWKIDFDACADVPSLMWQGETWNLLQIHIHSPSEHTIGGGEFDAEVHMVHLKDGTEADLLVVGVMYDVSTYGSNIGLDGMWNVLGMDLDSTTESFEVAVYDLLPSSPAFSHYMGSLTTPPCTQGVTWIVMDQPSTISKEQLDAYRNSVLEADGSKAGEFGETNRPTMPLNNRPLRFVAP